MADDNEEMTNVEIVSTQNWKVIPRIARTIPFGYEAHPTDPDLLLPIVLELEALEKAKRHLKNYSYRDVAKWLEEVTGRYVSHVGLRKRIENDRKNKSLLRSYKLQAKWLEEAIRKIEKANNFNTSNESITNS